MFAKRWLSGRSLGRRLGLAVLALTATLSAVPAVAAASPPPPSADPAAHHAGFGAERTRDGTRHRPKAASVLGVDVSEYQGRPNWSAVAREGIDFAYVKATEATSYVNPNFAQQYNGSYNAGLVRGAYHFAVPSVSGGARQAEYFVKHGGGWSADGRTLPPALDMEYNPYPSQGNSCYNLTDRQMINWIGNFSTRLKQLTGRYPVIYTTTDWWATCTGNTARFSDTSPLWIANWSSSPGPLPNGWSFQTFWQYTSTGRVNGISGDVDRNVFNGSMERLRALARG